jgi:hypothetical protein
VIRVLLGRRVAPGTSLMMLTTFSEDVFITWALGLTPRLTSREREVVGLVGAGLCTRRWQPGCTSSRARSSPHVSAVLAQLGLRNRVQLAIPPMKPRCLGVTGVECSAPARRAAAAHPMRSAAYAATRPGDSATEV